MNLNKYTKFIIGFIAVIFLIGGLIHLRSSVEDGQNKINSPAVFQFLKEAKEAEQKGRAPEAVSAYEKALELDPHLGEAYFGLGSLYFRMKLPTKAQDMYEMAVQKGHKAPQVYFQLGYIKEQRKDYTGALQDYLQAERGGLKNADLFFNIGNVYAQLEKKKDAVKYYSQAVDTNPKHLNAMINLSVMCFHIEEYADAKIYLDRAIVLGYQSPQGYEALLLQKMVEKK